MTSLSFQDPQALWLLFTVPLLFFLVGRLGSNSAILFSSTQLFDQIHKLKKNNFGRFLAYFKIIAIIFFIIALARPQRATNLSYSNTNGIDILLAIDISGSMLTLDFSTQGETLTRIDAVKDVVEEFIQKRPSDRIGLIAFARYPYLVSPLTLNHDWVISNLKRILVGTVPDGTAIGTAIAASINRLKNLNSKSKIIILLTDGENNTGEITPEFAAELAASFNIRIYTIAAGKGGPSYAYQADSKGYIIKDQFGQKALFPVDFDVDTDSLIQIADSSEGKFFHANNKEELTNIYNEIDQLEKTKINIKQYAQFDELFHIPLLIGLILLLLEKILTSTRFRTIP